MEHQHLVLRFDGGCEPRNPGGVATWGWLLESPEGEALEEACGVAYPMGHRLSTNNVAEWTALLKGLLWLEETGFRGHLTAKGDSMLVVKGVTGRWRCKAPHLKPLCLECRRIAEGFASFDAEWVPRGQNQHCDELSARAYREHVDEICMKIPR